GLQLLTHRQSIDDQRDNRQGEPGRRIAAMPSGTDWACRAHIGSLARFEPRRRSRGDEPYPRMTVGHDDPADGTAGPVHFRIGVLRPADFDAHPWSFGAGGAVDDLNIAGLARLVLAADRATVDDSQAHSRRMAE